MLLAMLIQYGHYYPVLPARIANHFDLHGNPNAYMDKPTGFLIQAAVIPVLLFLGWGLPLLMGRLPVGMINLPRKDYWLAPERKLATLADLRERCGWIAALVLALMFGVNELAFRANLLPEPRLSTVPFWCVLGTTLLALGFWTVQLLRHYNAPPQAD